ncbi:hypothetical protein AKJ63_01210, partial [candidate division MSBL1 archaeon SCGC-AAA259D18]
KLAEEGLEYAKKAVKEKEPDLLVLDEINLAVHCDLLNVNEVIQFLGEIPEEMDVFLTGRYAPEELIETADSVTKILDVKNPNEMITKKGIQY